jgi:hypothetical protein
MFYIMYYNLYLRVLGFDTYKWTTKEKATRWCSRAEAQKILDIKKNGSIVFLDWDAPWRSVQRRFD